MIQIFIYIALISTLLFSSSISDETDTFSTKKIGDFETKACMNQWMAGNFGLKPHKVNYILPYGYRFGKSKYTSYVPSDSYKNYEAELQISLKLNIANNILGLHESYNVAYSHKSFWQLYVSSSPFRETNYNPEMFVIFPIEDNSIFHLKSLTFSFAHLSNGQGNIEEAKLPIDLQTNKELSPYLRNRSRSINYFSSQVSMQYDNVIVDVKAWVPYFGDDLSDNKDLMDYMGYSSIAIKYFYKKHMLTLDASGNLFSGKGAMEGTYSYPLYPDLFLYVKFFSGYNESLIDYNNYVSKLAIGFSFSR